jgi:TRAP-type C4-dicarboxylate transport system permease small subunit
MLPDNVGLKNEITYSIANIAIFFMMIIVTVNALSRYLLNSSLNFVVGTTELYLLPAIIYFSFGNIEREDRHIKLGIVPDSISNRVYRALKYCLQLVLLGLFVLLTWNVATEALELTRIDATIAIGLPIYLSWWIIVVGLLALIYRLVLEYAPEFLLNFGSRALVVIKKALS